MLTLCMDGRLIMHEGVVNNAQHILLLASSKRDERMNIRAKVKPNAKENNVRFSDGVLYVSIKARNEKGLANRALVTYLSKVFGCDVTIVRGAKQRTKLIALNGMDETALETRLKQLEVS